MPCADQAGNAQDARIPGMLKEASSIKQFSHSFVQVTTIHQLKVVVASGGYLSNNAAAR